MAALNETVTWRSLFTKDQTQRWLDANGIKEPLPKKKFAIIVSFPGSPHVVRITKTELKGTDNRLLFAMERVIYSAN